MQYAVAPGFHSEFDDASLQEDHTLHDRRLHISHQTVAASPYFWTPHTQWRKIASRQGIDFMPFADPRTPANTPAKTRPITYRFWDTFESCIAGHDDNPRFEVSYVDMGDDKVDSNLIKSLPDIQAYRDAMHHFVVDETDLYAFHKEVVNKDATDDEVKAAGNPHHYVAMENSGTMKDVEYVGKPAKPIFEDLQPMGQRRALYFKSMYNNNPNSVRDFRNTFCVDPTSVDLKDLSHYTQYDGDKGKYPDAFMPNVAEFQRLTGDNDMAGAADVFNAHIKHSALTVEHHAITSAFVQWGLTQAKEGLTRMRADAIKRLVVHLTDKYVKDITITGIQKLVEKLSRKMSPKIIDGLLKLVTKAPAEGQVYDRAAAIEELGTDLANLNTKELQTKIMDNLKAHAKEAVLGADTKTFAPEIPTATPIPQAEVVNGVPRDAWRVNEGKLAPDYPLHDDALPPFSDDPLSDEAGVFNYMVKDTPQVVKTDVAFETAEAVEVGEVAEGAAAAAEIMSVAAITPILAEVAPIAIITGILIGINALENAAKKKEAAREAKELAKKREEQAQADVAKYYEEMIDLDFGQRDSTQVKHYWDEQQMKYQVPYNQLLADILGNFLSIHVVNARWMTMNAWNSKGMNLLTAEMLREMRVVDYYLRDDANLHPSAAKPGTWTTTTPRPFPAIANEPITFIGEAMTPLPVLNRSIHAFLTSHCATPASSEPVIRSDLLGLWMPVDDTSEGTHKLKISATTVQDISGMPQTYTVTRVLGSQYSLSYGGGSTANLMTDQPNNTVRLVTQSTHTLFKRDPSSPAPTSKTQACYKKMEEKLYGPWTPALVVKNIPPDSVSTDDGKHTIPIEARLDTVLPVPVFVGFATSPTGFVSSEDRSIAWPTIMNKAHGGQIPPPSLYQRPDFHPGFPEDTDLYQWLQTNQDAKLITTESTGIGMILGPIKQDLAKGCHDEECHLLTVCNKTGRSMSLVAVYDNDPNDKQAFMKVRRIRDFPANPTADVPVHQSDLYTAQVTVLAAPTHLGCFKDDGWDGYFKSGTQTGSGRALPKGGGTYNSAADAFAAAKAQPDVFYVGLQDLQGTKMQAWFGGQNANYAKYGKTTCVDPNGTSGGKSGIYDVGGYYTNAVYQVRRMNTMNNNIVELVFMLTSEVALDSISTRFITESQFYTLRTTPAVRTPWFVYNKGTYAGSQEVELQIMGQKFVCPGRDQLLTKMTDARKQIKGKEPGYANLIALFDLIRREMVVQSADGCQFAYWLAQQFGANTISGEVGRGAQTFVTVMEPYTPIRQRALFFTFQWVWSKKGNVLSAGEHVWNQIFQTLMVDGDHTYVLDIPLYTSMYKATVEVKQADVDITPVPAGTINVGFQFTRNDRTQNELSSLRGASAMGVQQVGVWTEKYLWDVALYKANKTDPNYSAEYADALNFAREFASVSGAYGTTDAFWEFCLPVINDKRVGVWKTDSPGKPWMDAKATSYEAAYNAAEHFRRARVSVCTKWAAHFDVVSRDVILGEQSAPAADATPFRLMSAAEFALNVRYMVKTALEMRELPHFKVVDNAALQSISGATQLMAKMSADCYKDMAARLHLEDPRYNSVYWFQRDISTSNTSVYFNPSSKGTLQTPCVVMAYRGTAPEKELEELGTGTKLNKYFRVATDSAGDLVSDLHILVGTQITSQRFQNAAAMANVIKDTGFPEVPYIYFTGHSLGGALAMNTLHMVRGPRIVKAVVFNPGVGADINYLKMVNDDIKNYKANKRVKRETDQDPWHTKLETHRIGGSNTSLAKKDPVSMLSGGLGLATHLYEGYGIPDNIQGHSIRNFPQDKIHGITTLNHAVPTTQNTAAVRAALTQPG